MLSRVAERVYWMSRYLERAQDTARLTQTYSHLIMDLPKGAEPPWHIMVDILDAQAAFAAKYRQDSEKNVLKFLIADQTNPVSIPFSVRAARENVRTTRDVLPDEAWELVNELYLYVKDNAEKSAGRRLRYDFLSEVISRCQMINGLLMDSLSRDHTYGFVKLGRLVECADMTTRIVDVGAGNIMTRSEQSPAIDPLLWGALLKGLSAATAYRRAMGPIVEKEAAIDFIFKDTAFPRSVKYCLRGIIEELPWLKNYEPTMKVAEKLRRDLGRLDPEAMTPQQVHEYIDDFQHQLSRLHTAIQTTWFS